MLALLALSACELAGVGEPEPVPRRVEPERFTAARSWVRAITADGDAVVWASYDVSTGRSARAVIDRVGPTGGSANELFEEPHPPQHVAVWDGHLYWAFESGPLRRAPLGGGEPALLVDRTKAACFDVDASGLYLIVDADVVHVDPSSGARRVVAQRSLGECPVALGDRVYWTERKGVYSAPKSGGPPERLAELSVPAGLLAWDGALYACVSEVLTRIDPATGEVRPVRDVCRADGLVVRDGAHWFRAPGFSGWPPTERARIAEVSARGVSWLFDGMGASPPVVAGDHLVWFGRPDGGGVDWQGYRVPLP